MVGGGAGGCSTAAKFASKYPGQVAVIEPREVRHGHLYTWTGEFFFFYLKPVEISKNVLTSFEHR